jgi:N-acetylglucosaminyldiphosphoundecaprenol N-acetyl-beta-D-mannosaminyltransferase
MRVRFLGLPIDTYTMAQTVDLATDAMRTRRRTQHVAVNVAKIVRARSDSVLRSDLVSSDVVGVDGMGVLLGLRLSGVAISERVAGIDLMEEILARCATTGFRPFFLGATALVVQGAAAAAVQKFPALQFAGVHDGYFSHEQEPFVVKSIAESGADCLFIGIPTPRKERFLNRFRDELSVPFIMGVGGAFDILAGKVARAPLWMQRSGLEWLYRVYQEPHRMWWRYLSTNTIYAALLFAVGLRRLLGRPTRE